MDFQEAINKSFSINLCIRWNLVKEDQIYFCWENIWTIAICLTGIVVYCTFVCLLVRSVWIPDVLYPNKRHPPSSYDCSSSPARYEILPCSILFLPIPLEVKRGVPPVEWLSNMAVLMGLTLQVLFFWSIFVIVEIKFKIRVFVNRPSWSY